MEFGVRWGPITNLFQSLRGIYEPFNKHRKVIGFDTFEGFTETTELDGNSKEGDFAVINGYGNALIEGINACKTEYCCIINADGSMNPSYLADMLLKCENHDFQ